MSMLLTLLVTGLGEFGRLMLSSPNACLSIARVSVALFPRFDAVPLSNPSREIALKGRTNQHIRRDINL
jgi:hypothetical protein